MSWFRYITIQKGPEWEVYYEEYTTWTSSLISRRVVSPHSLPHNNWCAKEFCLPAFERWHHCLKTGGLQPFLQVLGTLNSNVWFGTGTCWAHATMIVFFKAFPSPINFYSMALDLKLHVRRSLLIGVKILLLQFWSVVNWKNKKKQWTLMWFWSVNCVASHP